MSNLSYKTISANKATVNKEWVLVDAADQTVGRLASEIAKILRGKHKPNFTPHVDCGDYVIVINAEKVKFTGKKMQEKEYVFYSGHPGGQKWRTAAMLMKKKPEMILEKAIKGMLPGNILGADLFRNLHVYVGSEHKHEAQKPQLIKF